MRLPSPAFTAGWASSESMTSPTGAPLITARSDLLSKRRRWKWPLGYTTALVYVWACQPWPPRYRGPTVTFRSKRKIWRPRNKSPTLYQVTYFSLLTVTSEVPVVRGKVGQFSVQVTDAKHSSLTPYMRTLGNSSQTQVLTIQGGWELAPGHLETGLGTTAPPQAGNLAGYHLRWVRKGLAGWANVGPPLLLPPLSGAQSWHSP